VDKRRTDRSPSTDFIRKGVSKDSGDAKMLAGPLPSGTYYIYSFDGRLLAEYNLLGQVVRDYVYFGGQLVAEYKNGVLHYYVSDQINSTRIVTDSTGTVVYSAAHEPYGGIQKTWVTTAFDPELKFSGKPRDAESDLDYFGARYYDRAQYRFLSVDPVIPAGKAVSNPQRWNLYAYCLDNPIRYLDPDGADAIHFTIRRDYIQDNTMFGVMYSEDRKFQVMTMEPVYTDGKTGSAIPDGEYTAKPSWHQGHFALELSGEGLRGRKGKVAIHFGRVREASQGCILIGTEYDEKTKKLMSPSGMVEIPRLEGEGKGSVM